MTDDDLCTSEYPDTENEGYIGHLCNLPVNHDGEHKALAEVGPGWRRHITWPNADLPAGPVTPERHSTGRPIAPAVGETPA